MVQTTIDTLPGTHGSYKALIAKGFSESQAEGIIEVMHHRGMDYATKADLERETALLRSDLEKTENALRSEIKETENLLKADITTVANKLDKTENVLRTEMQQMETRLTKLVYINTFAIISVITAVIKFL